VNTGAAAFFLIGRMVTKKTFKVFNKQTAASFGVYSLLTAVFILTFVLDLTGFENRVPSDSKISGVTVTCGVFYLGNLGFSPGNDSPTVTLSTADNIKAARELHKKAIANRAELEDMYNNNAYWYVGGSFTFRYGLGQSEMYRAYNVTYPLLDNSAELKRIFESEEYKSRFSLSKVTLNGLAAIDVIGYGQATVSDKAEINELLLCAELDFREQTYEEALDKRMSYAYLNFRYEGAVGKSWEDAVRVRIPKSYNNTVKWLRDNGYGEQIEITPDMIAKLTVYQREQGQSGDYTQGPSVTVTGKEEIAAVLNTAEMAGWGRTAVYYIAVPEFETRYTEKYNSGNIRYLHSDEALPAFIKGMF
jgi:ABC-2 type transport system permease protein